MMPSPATLGSSKSKIGARMQGRLKSTPALSTQNRRNATERNYKPGDFLFIEGERGREMFIIKKGKVRILKQQGPAMVELVALGPGAVLGEMGLLDNSPRSATARAIEHVSVAVINETNLEANLENVPKWLSSVIRIVVQRLRETTNRRHEEVLRNSVPAVLKTLLQTRNQTPSNPNGIPLELVREGAFNLFGLTSADCDAVLGTLVFKDLIEFDTSDQENPRIRVLDYELIKTYLDFLRRNWKGSANPAEAMSQQDEDYLRSIVEAAQQLGRKQKGHVFIDVKQVELYLQKKSGSKQALDKDILDRLIESQIVQSGSKDVKTSHGKHKHDIIQYNEQEMKDFFNLREKLELLRIDTAELAGF